MDVLHRLSSPSVLRKDNESNCPKVPTAVLVNQVDVTKECFTLIITINLNLNYYRTACICYIK